MTTLAVVENGAAFISTTQLHRRVADLLARALGAALVDGGHGRDLVAGNSLDGRLQLLAQLRREVGGLGLGGNDLGGNIYIHTERIETCKSKLCVQQYDLRKPTSVLAVAGVAAKNALRGTLGGRQKVAAHGAEHKRADRCHDV